MWSTSVLHRFIPLAWFAITVVCSPVDKRQQQSLYIPLPAPCPSTPLIRPAKDISDSERQYFTARKPVAQGALKTWLEAFECGFSTSKLPSIALATSGGGLRSFLEGAGVIQALDSRDSNTTIAGIYQALTYQSGLSGGAWLVGSLSGNNWPTVSSLRTGLWNARFATGTVPSKIEAQEIVFDLLSKKAAGFSPTLTDPYGRVVSFSLLYGPDGGVTNTLSGLTSKTNFTAHAVPYPIMTAIDTNPGQCIPDVPSPQFELHPYEFGSWDSGIAAFTETAYLGTNMSNGQPATAGVCVKNYDNLGYAMGTSSNIFSESCQTIPSVNSSDPSIAELEQLLSFAHPGTFGDEFADYPNPFYGYSGSPTVKAEKELTLVDGGFSSQNDPIWPFIQPARAALIDVLIVNDNSADTNNFPNGTQIYNTYLRAQRVGLSSMPQIPPVKTFLAKGYNKRAVFFGCHKKHTITIVYLPNTEYSFPSNQSTTRLLYSKADTDGMIGNGMQIATQNGDKDWPTCLACAVMMKTTGGLPWACKACFAKYCYDG